MNRVTEVISSILLPCRKKGQEWEQEEEGEEKRPNVQQLKAHFVSLLQPRAKGEREKAVWLQKETTRQEDPCG